MARTTINSLGIPDDTIVSADLDYPLTGFSSTGITDNATSTALTIDSSGNIAVTGTIDGRDLAADGTKLDGVPATATDYDDTDVASYLSTNGYDTATNIVATITDSAPLTLDTLNELAAALGDDPNFAATTAASIGLKAPLASPSFTGKVGIGHSPTYDLDTLGQVRANVANAGAWNPSTGAWNYVPQAHDALIVQNSDNVTGTDSAASIFFSAGGRTSDGTLGAYGRIAVLRENDSNQNSAMAFWVRDAVSGGEKMRIDSSGNLLVGQTSATAFSGKVIISDGAVGGSTFLDICNGNNDNQFLKLGINNNTAMLGFDDNDSFAIGRFTNASATTFQDQFLTVLNSGNVGIGTSSPQSKATVSGNVTNAALPIGSASASAAQLRIANNFSAGYGHGGELLFEVATPGSAPVAGIRGTYQNYNGAGDFSGTLVFGTQKTLASGILPRMTIDQDGRVGIDNTDPKSTLHVGGEIISGAGASTQGQVILKSEYLSSSNDFVNILGTERSTSSWVIGYGVKPSPTTSGVFLSTADNSNFARGALLIDDELVFMNTGAQTVAVDSAITLTERMRIGSAGQFGIGGANYGTSGQVLTSNGSASAPSWQDALAPGYEVLQTTTLTSSATSISFNTSGFANYKLLKLEMYIILSLSWGSGDEIRLVPNNLGSATQFHAGQIKSFNTFTYPEIASQNNDSQNCHVLLGSPMDRYYFPNVFPIYGWAYYNPATSSYGYSETTAEFWGYNSGETNQYVRTEMSSWDASASSPSTLSLQMASNSFAAGTVVKLLGVL